MNRVGYLGLLVMMLNTPTVAAQTPQEVFDQRILPIFKSPAPSSCAQCHLAGVDLKQYILPSAEKTFLSLRDQGLVNLDKPADSKILQYIQMGAKDNPGAALISKKVRDAEYAAFSTWLQACCADPKLRAAPKLADAELAKPARPVEVIRHARKDSLLESFERNVWAMRFRCMSCHLEGSAENAKLRKEYGDKVAWFKKDGPEATMNYLLGSKLIDVKTPEKSLLLLKPLMEVKHEGGKKFLPGDQGYKSFRAWLDDYARTVADGYRTAAELPPAPPDRHFGSDIWLKLTNTPPAWGDKLAQATVYAWDAKTKSWETTPIATTDRQVFAKGKQWQHNLVLLAAPDSERAAAWRKGAPTLPAGKYLVKIHVDTQGKLAKDWTAALGTTEYAGQAEIDTRWPAGYGSMTTLDAAKVRR